MSGPSIAAVMVLLRALATWRLCNNHHGGHGAQHATSRCFALVAHLGRHIRTWHLSLQGGSPCRTLQVVAARGRRLRSDCQCPNGQTVKTVCPSLPCGPCTFLGAKLGPTVGALAPTAPTSHCRACFSMMVALAGSSGRMGVRGRGRGRGVVCVGKVRRFLAGPPPSNLDFHTHTSALRSWVAALPMAPP